MGFQGVGAGGMGNSDAALITQMRSVVESTLVDEDAKLNLVKDYGSDRTVSHRGSWSILSPLVNSRRIQEIRTAFADALNSMTGRVDGGSTGSPELDSIIDQLKASSKPLTKREVRQVLDKASAFIDFEELKMGLESSRTSCGKLREGGNALSAKLDGLEKQVQGAKVCFTEPQLEAFKSNYAEVQRLRSEITSDFNEAFRSETEDKFTYRKVRRELLTDVSAADKPDSELQKLTFQQLVEKKRHLEGELKQPGQGEGGAKDPKDLEAAKGKLRAVDGELKRMLRMRLQETSKLKMSIPSEIRDQLAVTDDYKINQERQAEFVSQVKTAFGDDLKDKNLTYDQAVEFVNEKLKKDGLSEEDGKRLEELSARAQEIKQQCSTTVRSRLDAEDAMACVRLMKDDFLSKYHTSYPDADANISFEDAVKALKGLKVVVPEDLKGVEDMSLQALKDKAQSLVYEEISAYDGVEKHDDVEKQDDVEKHDGVDDLAHRKAVVDDLIKQKSMLEAAEAVENAIQQFESAVPQEVREAITQRKAPEPNLDEFKVPAAEENPKGKSADFAIGKDAYVVRSKLLAEIAAMKTELQNLTAALQETDEAALEMLQRKPGPVDDSYEQGCLTVQEKVRDQKEALEKLQKKLDNLLSRYDETFVTPRKFAEAAKLQGKVNAKNEDIQALAKQIEELAGVKHALKDGSNAEKELSYEEAKELVSKQQQSLNQKRNEFSAKRVKSTKEDEVALQQLQKDIKDLETLVAENEKRIEEKWAGQIRKLEGDIAAKKDEIAKLKNDVVEKTAPTRVDRPQQQGIEYVDGTFRISGKWLRNETGSILTTGIYREIQTNVFGKLDGFSAWFAGECKNRVASALGVKAGLSENYFNILWKQGSMDGLAESLRKLLNKQYSGDEEIYISADEMKHLLVMAQADRTIAEEPGDLYVNISTAEEKLKALTAQENDKNPAFEKLENDYNQWKTANFDSLKTVLDNVAFERVVNKINEGYELLKGVAEGKTLNSLATGEGERRTLFNLLVSFLAKNADKNDVALFDVIKDDLNAQVKGYKLDDKNAGKIEPKLPLPPDKTNDRPDRRLVQMDGDSPHATITKLLSKEPKVGLIQKGGNSCWMISVVNGLLTSPAGCKILQECFKDPEKCVFKARTSAGGTKEIVIGKQAIDDVLNENKGLSRLEAAIWLGVRTMVEDKDRSFEVRGCLLGAQGEASEAAMLFGLRSVMNESSKSMDDNDSSWVVGANALHGNKVVVLHRGAQPNSGHFLTAVGTDFKAGENNKAPEKAFHIHDSLQADPTTKLTSEQLNVDWKKEKEQVYQVLAFEIPGA